MKRCCILLLLVFVPCGLWAAAVWAGEQGKKDLKQDQEEADRKSERRLSAMKRDRAAAQAAAQPSEEIIDGKTLGEWKAWARPDASDDQRQAAARALGRTRSEGIKAAVPILLQLLADKGGDVRQAAIEALGQLGPAAEEALPALTKLAEKRDRHSVAALRAMGRIVPEALPSLTELAERGTIAGDHRPAIDALGRAGPKVIPTLVKLLRDEDRWVRYAASSNLERIGRDAPRDVLVALTPLTRDPDVQVRWYAVHHLSRIETKEAVPFLLDALQDVDGGVREPAVRRLVKLAKNGDKEVIPALTHFLQNSSTRMTAAALLGLVAPEAVWEAVQDESPAIRCHAAIGVKSYALSPAAFQTVLPTLRKFLQDPDPAVRAAVTLGMDPPMLEALARDQNPHDLSATASRLASDVTEIKQKIASLNASHRQEDWDKATALERALRRRQAVARSEAAAKAVAAAREASVQALQDSDPKVRRTAACDLASVQPPVAGAVPILVEGLRDPDFRVPASAALASMGSAAREAVPALVEVLQDPNQTVRAQAVVALGNIRSATPAVVSAVAKALQDPDGEVRTLAAKALGRFGPTAQAAVPALVESLKDSGPATRAHAARALGRLGPPTPATLAALTKTLQDEEPLVRFAAVDALARLGPAAKDAIPALEQATRDYSCYVRWNVTRALKEIRPSVRAPR